MLLHCNISTTSVAFLQRAATMRAVLHVAIAFLSMRLSVCLSVRHTPVLCQNEWT